MTAPCSGALPARRASTVNSAHLFTITPVHCHLSADIAHTARLTLLAAAAAIAATAQINESKQQELDPSGRDAVVTCR